MRRIAGIILVLVLLLNIQGCQYNQKHMEPQKIPQSKLMPENKSEAKGNIKIIKSTSEDLNGDGIEEKIEILELSRDKGDGAVESEGKLRITEENTSKEITYRKSGSQLTGVFQELLIEDLDRDGVRDIMVVIPDSGGSGFTHNYFFAYDYKNDRRIDFNQDYINDYLDSLFKSFKFDYTSKGKLKMYNEQSGFETYLDVMAEENKDVYDRAYIDLAPSAVMKEEQSKANQEDKFISSIGIVDNQIRVPFLIYGQSAGDTVGEIDVFFSINKEFELEAKRFEVFDFDDNFKKINAGKGIIE